MNAIDCKHLQPYLDEQLSGDPLQQFEEHLSTCGDCRRALDAKADSAPGWTAVRDVLQPSADVPSWSATQQPAPDRAAETIAALRLSPTDDPSSMGRVGSYEVGGLVGRGGMGIVLKASDPALGRTVAIKMLDPSLASVGASRKRFAKEARSMAAISHEHVVPIYGVDEHAGTPYFVMEYVAGGTLEGRIRQDGPLDVLSALRITQQIASALRAAHGCGVVHRDIKPANILVDAGVDRIRVTDFGLARVVDDAQLTNSGLVAGTPQYMSPEQVRGETCDDRSDLFGLGCLLYAMLVGHSPFRASTLFGAMQRVVHETPRSMREQNAAVPLWLEALTFRLLAKGPGDRFQSAEELVAVLEMELRHLQEPASVPEPPRPWMPAQAGSSGPRGKRIAAIGLAGIGLAAGLGFLGSWLNRPGPQEQGTGGAGAGIAHGRLGLPTSQHPEREESPGEIACAQLIDAIQARNIEKVKELLQETDPNTDCLDPTAERQTMEPPRRSPLVAAAGVGSIEIAGMLLDAGADVNHASIGESTPLMVAAENGDLDMLRFLLTRGSDVNRSVPGRGRALSAASAAGQLAAIAPLLKAGATIDATVDGVGCALLTAAGNGHTPVVSALIAKGAALGTATPGVGTPLSRAVANGHRLAMETLVAAGASVEGFAWGAGTPLMEAVRSTDRGAIDWLLERGADLNAGVHGVGIPLICALRGGDRSTAEYLLSKGADVNARVDGVGTALMIACGSEDREQVDFLLSLEADVDRSVDGIGTPLSVAVDRGSLELVQLLLHSAAKPSHRADGTDAPLLAAVLDENAEITKALLKAGADPDGSSGPNRPTPREAAAGGELDGLFRRRR